MRRPRFDGWSSNLDHRRSGGLSRHGLSGSRPRRGRVVRDGGLGLDHLRLCVVVFDGFGDDLNRAGRAPLSASVLQASWTATDLGKDLVLASLRGQGGPERRRTLSCQYLRRSAAVAAAKTHLMCLRNASGHSQRWLGATVDRQRAAAKKEPSVGPTLHIISAL